MEILCFFLSSTLFLYFLFFYFLSTQSWVSRRQEASTRAIRSLRLHFSWSLVLFWVFRIFSLRSLAIPSSASHSWSTLLRVVSSILSFYFPVCQATPAIPSLAFFSLQHLCQFQTIPSRSSLPQGLFVAFLSTHRCRSLSHCLPSQAPSPHLDNCHHPQASPVAVLWSSATLFQWVLSDIFHCFPLLEVAPSVPTQPSTLS